MRIKFTRKAKNLTEAKSQLERVSGSEKYEVVKERVLTDLQFEALSNNLLIIDMFTDFKGGIVDGVRQVIRIVNNKTGEDFVVDPQGYSYCRVVGLE